MKLLRLLTTTALLSLAKANFDIYMLDDDNEEQLAWQVYPAEPGCSEVNDTPLWDWRGDVSGNKLGFRCEGSGCGWSDRPEDINVLEMNFSNAPVLHWTLYKDRGWTMVGLDGNTYGDCLVFPNGDFNCGRRKGHRKFRCLTSWTADRLNNFE